MSLRILEANLPESVLDEVPAFLEGQEIVQFWVDGPAGPVRILLESTDTEKVSDLLVRQFGHHAGFRLNLFRVEATLPAVEEKAGAATSSKERKKKSRRVSREELYSDLSRSSRVTPIYIAMVALSTVVAAVGLIRGDVAIIIGAMVIAPLLGPNVGLSLAAALGDRELFKHSLKAIFVGVLIASALSIVLGLLINFDPPNAAILSRTQPGLGDIALGLAAGAAGALAFTSGIPSVVVGVMVAVALLPPLVVAGLMTGAGQWPAAAGALVLCLTNVSCINLSAMATFYIQDVRPRTWWEADRARKGSRRAGLAWLLMLSILAAMILLSQRGWVG